MWTQTCSNALNFLPQTQFTMGDTLQQDTQMFGNVQDQELWRSYKPKKPIEVEKVSHCACFTSMLWWLACYVTMQGTIRYVLCDFDLE